MAFGIVTTDRGDVRALTDGAGAAFAFYSFDAYGRPLGTQTRATGSVDATQAAAVAGANVLGYAGYAYDAHSGLYYCSARYLDPETASFITKDPAKADGEESAYQYCGGDPVGKVDPSGEKIEIPGWVKSVWNFPGKQLRKLGNKWKKLTTMTRVITNMNGYALFLYDTYRKNWPDTLRDHLIGIIGDEAAQSVDLKSGVTKQDKIYCGRDLPEYKKRVVKEGGKLVVQGVEFVWK